MGTLEQTIINTLKDTEKWTTHAWLCGGIQGAMVLVFLKKSGHALEKMYGSELIQSAF